MSEAATIQRLEQKVDRLVKLVAELRQPKSAGRWGSAKFAMQITGWNPEELRQAREQGIVKVKRDAGKDWRYDLNDLAIFKAGKTA